MIQITTLFDCVLEKKVPYGDEIIFLLECGVKSGDPAWAESCGMSDTVRKFLEEHPHLKTDPDVLDFLKAFSLGFDSSGFSYIDTPTSKRKEAQVRISNKYDMPYDEIKKVPDDWFSTTCKNLIENFKDYLV